jgi:hypothetical protein
VQEFDSNFLEAKVRGLESPVGAACWYLLYRDLEREDRPVDRNLTKKERERAVIACYKAAGDHLLARREAGSLRLRNKLDWGLLQQDSVYLLSEAFRGSCDSLTQTRKARSNVKS